MHMILYTHMFISRDLIGIHYMFDRCGDWTDVGIGCTQLHRIHLKVIIQHNVITSKGLGPDGIYTFI